MIRQTESRADHDRRNGSERATSEIEEEKAGMPECTGLLTIECQRTERNGTVVLTAKLGDEVVSVDKLDLAKQAARDKFVKNVCKDHAEVSQEDLSKRLLDLATTVGTDGTAPTSSEVGREIDVSKIVRPEQFITPWVSGLTIPITTEIGGLPVAQWRLHLQWADGRRECRDLGTSIDLPAKKKLWLQPGPSPPTASMLSAWSQSSRDAWLKGGKGLRPEELFERICEQIAHFIDFPRGWSGGTTASLALWGMLTYCYTLWDAVPYLYVGGPIGSGKSRVFEVLSRFAFRPLVSSNLTAAAMFRTLHDRGGTLLLDEAERLKETKAPDVGDIRAMLLAGYKRGGQATRLEKVGDSFETANFDVYSPKALACIKGLPPALASRCIPITMFRAERGSAKPRQRIDKDPATWQRLRDGLHVMVLEHGAEWSELVSREDVCPEMSGRNYELWHPILALASWTESHGASGLLDLLKDHALKTIVEYADDQVADVDEVLLRILADAVREGEAPQAKELLDRARDQEPDSFKTWSPKGVATALNRYGLRTHKTGGCRRYGHVTLPDLRRIQGAYSLDLGFEQVEESRETFSGPPAPDGD